jgi:tRNA pseudouridine synthase 10
MSQSVPDDKPRPRSNLYLESRYRKLRRGLPQTIFYCPKCKGDRRRRRGCQHCEGFGKLTKDSVQELIGRRMVPQMQAKLGKFHGAGREDIDVLMLGQGRPFVFEVVGARNPNLDLEELRRDIEQRAEGAIELAPFERVERKRVVYWKETHFDKVYRADVAIQSMPSDERLAAVRAFAGGIVQRTPQRVAHRRADLERERRLRVLALDVRDEQTLELRVVCQHGTYVKEWISGDEQRTSPSLARLLDVGCHCAVLDVEEILTPGIEGPRLDSPHLDGPHLED